MPADVPVHFCFGCCVTRFDFSHSQVPPAVAAARPRGILTGRAHSPKVRVRL